MQTLLFEETHQLVRIEVRDLGFSTGTTLGVLTGPDMLSCWSDRNLRTQRVEPCTAADMLTSCRTFKVSDGTCWAGMLPVQGKILFVRHDGQRTILKAVEGDLDTHYGPRRHVILKLINLN